MIKSKIIKKNCVKNYKRKNYSIIVKICEFKLNFPGYLDLKSELYQFIKVLFLFNKVLKNKKFLLTVIFYLILSDVLNLNNQSITYLEN